MAALRSRIEVMVGMGGGAEPEPEITDVRRAVMARIRGKDTGPEIQLRKALWSLGIRYRLGQRIGRLRPDLVFKGARLAVYIDGCFWHGCPEHYTPPRSRAGFWSGKLRENVERDIRQTRQLVQAGWRVLRFWEHDVVLDPAVVAGVVAGCLRGDAVPSIADRWAVISAEPDDGQVRLELVGGDGVGAKVISRDLITDKPGRRRK